MNCEEFTEALLNQLDSAPGTDKLGELQAHELTCPHCREMAAQLRNLDQQLSAAFSRTALTVNFETELQERLRLESEFVRPFKKSGMRSSWVGELLCWGALAGLLCAFGGYLLLGWARQMDQPAVNIQFLTPLEAAALFLIAGLMVIFPLLRRFQTFQPWR